MIKPNNNSTIFSAAAIFVLLGTSYASSGSADFPSIAPGLPEINSGVQFCNLSDGDDYLWVAISHFSNGKWIREGWWKVPYNDCATVLGKIDNRYMYYHAHNGAGKTWRGNQEFCTKPEVFTIESGSSCSEQRLKGFKEIDLKDASSFRMTLN